MIKMIISLLCIVIPTMFFGIIERPVEMGIALVMGAIAASFINIDKFKSFKGAGFEAKLHEAKETIDKALVTVEKLKNVIEPLILHTLYNITHEGRIGSGGPTSDKDRIRDLCSEVVSDLDIENEEIKKALNLYNNYSVWDELARVESKIKYDGNIRNTLIDVIRSRFPKRQNDNNFPSTENIENLFI